MTTPFTAFETTLAMRFGGVLRHGKHQPDGQACALEAVSIAKGLTWTDDPRTVGLPDIRAINDAYRDDAPRTRDLVPVIEAYWDWATWSPARRRAVMDRIVIETVRQLIAELHMLPDAVRAQCRAVTTRQEAATAAAAARADAALAAADAALAAADASDAARAAAYAAAAAARVAAYAAYAAAAAARVAAYAAAAAAAAARVADAHTVLRRACALWIMAAESGRGQRVARAALQALNTDEHRGHGA
jgi:hypothetical protein